MARTEPSEQISIERVVGARGVVLERRGGRLLGLCPFHETAAPELVVEPRTNTWRCAECAPEPAGVVEWMMRAEGVSRVHASAMLRAGVVETREAKKRGRQKGAVPEHSTVPLLPMLFDGKESDAELLEKIAGFYAETIAHVEPALAFLKARQISERAVKAFQIGYADRTLGLRIPKPNRVLGARLRTRLGELGVMRVESGHEHLRGCVVVPLQDLEGRVAGMVGRRVERQRSERGEELPIGGGLFNAKALGSAKEIVITSSVLEALVVWSSGIEHVTALPTGGTPALLEALSSWGTKRVTLLIARTKEPELVTVIAEKGIEIFRAALPLGRDVEDLVRLQPGGREKLHQLLRLAEWAGGIAKPPTKISSASTAATPATSPAAAAAAERHEPAPKSAEEGLVYVLGDRRWRVRGLAENPSRGVLKVNVFVSREDVGFHVDTFDLYSSRHRTAFVHQAASELGVEEPLVKKDLGQVLLELENAQEELLVRLTQVEAKRPDMSDEERTEALELLQDPKLFERVLGGFSAMGIVGEETNLLLGYLVGVSRKLAEPLAMVIQSSSAAGKTALLDAILSTVPEEERASYAAISGQSLYYMGQRSLRHRVLSIAEQAGAEKAAYALRLLQSSKELTIASTGKDGASGKITSHEYKVEGPVALILTTTKVELDEELLNRCLVVTIDESAAQTRAVQEAQRRAQTLEGMLLRERRAGLERLHQNAERLLRPIAIVNPFSESIHFGDRRVRARRDHRKLLSLIETIALVQQHQRPLVRHELGGGRVLEYIEATTSDVALAEKLMRAVTGSAAEDFPPRTRELMAALGRYVEETSRARGVERSEVRFTRREVREVLGWGDTQLKTHLGRLVEAEAVIARRMPHGQGVAYELAPSSNSARPGLVATDERTRVSRAS